MVTIQAMHQLQRFVRARRAQCLDDAGTDATAAMLRNASRLVYHQQAFVFMQQRRAELFHQPV